MIATDFDTFFDGLQRVAIVCGRQKLTGDVAKTYFAMLEDLPMAPLLRAMEKFARTAETGRRFPSPRELREWVSTGGVAGLSDEETTRVWVRVNHAMREWEREGSPGSAWPSFELAWQAGCREEGVARRASTQNRQDCWQRWLSHGAVAPTEGPLVTSEQKAAILRDVMARLARGAYEPRGPELERSKAHWAAEDARTGRWKHAVAPGSGTRGFTRLGDSIGKVFADLVARHEKGGDREPGSES